MSNEVNPAKQLQDVAEIERQFKRLALLNPDQTEGLLDVLSHLDTLKREIAEKLIPEHIYINMQPVFAPVVLTIPNLQSDIPENVSAQRNESGMVITLKNNRRFQKSERGHNGLEARDWDIKTEIESVELFGEILTGKDLVTRRQELLQNFFVRMLEGEENVAAMTEAMERAGLIQGEYLYRAITKSEYAQLLKDRTLCYSHLDPSANFENEAMFQSSGSQVKHFAPKSEEGYAGQIIRWKIEHPLLYKTAGMSSPRVIPLFSHYLPVVEVSDDMGENFHQLMDTNSKTN